MNSLSPKILILIGFIIMVVGLSWMYAGKYFQWLGKLPGDIKIESKIIEMDGAIIIISS